MDLEKGEIKGVINFIDVFITFLEIARSHPVSEFRISLEYNASTRIPQFLPATIPVFLSPAEDIRRNFAVVTHAPRYSMVFGLKKRKRKERISAPTNFFPRKERKRGKCSAHFQKVAPP